MKPQNKKVTIYQVANRAGVAISTVSRVLNDSPNVSEKTKEKVKKAIDELNFRPQVSARKLASRKPQMLAIAVPSFTTPYYNEVLKGVKDEIGPMDLDIVIYNTGSKNPKEGIENFFNRGTADTVISISIDIDDNIHRQIQASGMPIVLIGSSHPEYDYIDLNHRKGGFLAGEHLVKQGYKKIGLIRPALETKAGSLREKGFLDALKEFKMPIHDHLFITGESTKHAGFTEEAGFEAINIYDQMGEFPDAIFCANDTQAIGAYHALNRLGMRVPDDIGLMGYDNIKFTKYLDLTTIDQKMHSIGVQATKRLAEIINGETDNKLQITIDPVLVPRNSTNNPNK
ncbi:LacI family DNA-binding transcriptional regulator [Rhodohalobacter halophilus]|uniref:LacI family DNA-binding transcriptional regulator n=1 Tax=Rhodohalobacter halophilus TaxID=1812810 RepID=UPI00083F744D|nr:LacI family DNA-binding transcriptional regulator [Rhodohalobacter halophilus]